MVSRWVVVGCAVDAKIIKPVATPLVFAEVSTALFLNPERKNSSGDNPMSDGPNALKGLTVLFLLSEIGVLFFHKAEELPSWNAVV